MFFKSLGGGFRRIRKRCANAPDAEIFAHKRWCLGQLEALSERGELDLLFGDASSVSSQGYVPYGWQFPGETVSVPVKTGSKVNIFGLISRSNQFHWSTTTENITAAYVIEMLDRLSWQICKDTVVVLDNASMHHARIFKERIEIWQRRGLYIFYLPPYSPHLNIAETLWRHLKKEWLYAADYVEPDTLFYAVNRCLANVGITLNINFSPFNAN